MERDNINKAGPKKEVKNDTAVQEYMNKYKCPYK